MNDRAKLLLQKVAPVLSKLPEGISMAGHTDAAPYKGDGMSNWELSSERANATRRLLVDAGLQETRFRSVTGNADRDPLIPADPLAAANRRIAIVVLRTRPAGLERRRLMIAHRRPRLPARLRVRQLPRLGRQPSAVLAEALPFELWTIGGAGVGIIRHVATACTT